MINSKPKRLFIVGGAADSCYVEFLKLAGGKDAHIVVLSHASSEPRKAGEAVKASLQALGASNVEVLTPRSTAGKGIAADVQGIFMAGGDQARLVRLLDKQGLSEQIRDAWRRGVLVGGSSAGAAACAPVMIEGGMRDCVLRRDALLLGKGLSLLPNSVIDTHFGQRNRHNRLRAAIATLNGTVGIGLDEDTALLIEGGKARVVGAGSVYIYRRDRKLQSTDWESIAAACLVHHFEATHSFSFGSELVD
ncbi:MAG: cyanophycinase [Cyanobacteria bacterium SZAS TMP-1]|nr:cyanophycinase [Cyanobacteria bacterium SZAS TMP-1]